MAPSLEVDENDQVDYDAPLKAAPKLVAPEPGRSACFELRASSLTAGQQSIARDQSLSKPVKAMHALVVPTKPYALQHQKAQIRTFP